MAVKDIARLDDHQGALLTKAVTAGGTQGRPCLASPCRSSSSRKAVHTGRQPLAWQPLPEQTVIVSRYIAAVGDAIPLLRDAASSGETSILCIVFHSLLIPLASCIDQLAQLAWSHVVMVSAV